MVKWEADNLQSLKYNCNSEIFDKLNFLSSAQWCHLLKNMLIIYSFGNFCKLRLVNSSNKQNYIFLNLIYVLLLCNSGNGGT